MKKLAIIYIMLLPLTIAAQTEPVDIFILYHQSNAEGKGENSRVTTESIYSDYLMDDVFGYIFRKSNPHLESLKIETSRGSGTPLHGVDIPFSVRYYQKFGRPCYFIKYTVFNTGMAGRWNVHSGDLFDGLFNPTSGYLKRAIDSIGLPYRLAGVIGIGGEADATTDYSSQYYNNFKEFIDSVNVLTNNALHIYNRLHDECTYYEKINRDNVRDAQDRLADEYNNCFSFNCDTISIGLDELHFNTLGIYKLGNALFDTWYSMTEQSYCDSVIFSASATIGADTNSRATGYINQTVINNSGQSLIHNWYLTDQPVEDLDGLTSGTYLDSITLADSGCLLAKRYVVPYIDTTSAEDAESVIKVLLNGNSITYTNNMFQMFMNMTANKDVDYELTEAIAGGSSLSDRYNRYTYCVDSVEKGDHDFVTIQEYSSTPAWAPAVYRNWALSWDALVRDNDGTPVHWMNPAINGNNDQYMAIIDSITTLIGQETGSLVAPIGLAWKAVLDDGYETTYLYDGYIHPTYAGSYLNACVLYATFTEKSPIGLLPLALDENTATYLQTVAWEVYSDYMSENFNDFCNSITWVSNAVVSDITEFGGNNGAIDFSVSGGYGNYTYSWSNGATTFRI